MKKGCLLLLAIISLIYGHQGYKVVDSYANDHIKIKTSGKLSEITSQVTSILLETPDTGAIRDVKRIRRDGNNLFMLSDNRLLHFDIHGNFVNQIAGDINDEDGKIFIAEYVLNTDANQVIVIDSQRNVSKYDYAGNLISKARIEHPWYKLSAFAFHNGCLWATAETLVANEDNPGSYRINCDLYQLDTDMNEIFRQTLHTAHVGRNSIFNSGSCVSELLVDEEGVYAYSPPSGTEHLLRDTLYITERKKIPRMYTEGHAGMACIYPVRKGKRHMLSTCKDLTGNRSTLCYDHENFTAYILPDGFKDDFFNTGYIPELQPMDIYNNSYCFIKSGQEISGKLPQKIKNKEQAVLFIINLNA